jgi:hypothetical protein
MTIEGATVSLAAELRHAALQAAEATGTAFPSVFADAALLDSVKGRKIDELLAEHEAEAGEITKQEMQAMAKEMGLPQSFVC